ncbi:hypothetical protein BGZ59_006252, partial [Podila verticillata]
RGGLDRDNDEIRYSPPTPIGAPNDRHSYSTSDNSGAALTWNPDDENASLVGGYGQQHNQQQYHQGEERDLLSDENGFRPPSESFVATSMMPLAQNDPRHQRFSGGRVQGAFSPEPEMRELTPGQLRVVGSPSPSHADVEPAQGARASLEVRSEGADVRSQHGSIRSNVSGKDPQTDELKYLAEENARSSDYIVVGVNEFYTSKKCPMCLEFVYQMDIRRLYCKSCESFTHRDVMAGHNICNIMQGHLLEQKRPDYLQPVDAEGRYP